MTVRRATTSDVAAVHALERACFGDDAWSENLVVAELAGQTRHVLVVDDGHDDGHDDGGVVAYASITVAGDVADLMRIAVDPARRGEGLATALLEELLPVAYEQGAGAMLLEVAEHNGPARGLYDAFGFVPIGRRRHYYADGSDSIVMRRAFDRPSDTVES